jgi:site-specific recombinase XerD
MQQKLKLDEVVVKALKFIKEKLAFKYSTCQHYKIGWSLLKTFMTTRRIDFVNSLVCQQYVSSLCDSQKNAELSVKNKRSIQAVLTLTEFIQTGCIQKKKSFKYLVGEIGELIKSFIVFKEPRRLNSGTIHQIERNLSKFNFWLSTANIHTIRELKHSDIIRFIQGLDASQPGYIHLMLMHLRGFFKYLFHNNIVATNMAAAIPMDSYRSLAKLPSYYSEDEIKQVLEYVDRGTVLGKRDYAVFMLAMRLGMRASDIANLKFKHLDWKINTIIFRQQKGGEEIKLPLLPAVGNAILDYLQCARPKSDSKSVFLIFRTPCLPLRSQTVSGIIKRRLRNAHINLKNRKQGSHILRHSLVKQLLDNGRTLPVITEVLGHKSQESTRHYIRIDIDSLRKCALEVLPVHPKFYSQGTQNYFYL